MCEHRRVTGSIDIGALALGRWRWGAVSLPRLSRTRHSQTQGIERIRSECQEGKAQDSRYGENRAREL